MDAEMTSEEFMAFQGSSMDNGIHEPSASSPPLPFNKQNGEPSAHTQSTNQSLLQPQKESDGLQPPLGGTHASTATSEEARISVSTVSSAQSHVHSVANSVHSEASQSGAKPITNSVQIGSGGLRLNTFGPTSTISHISSTVNALNSRPAPIVNSTDIIPNRTPKTHSHSYSHSHSYLQGHNYSHNSNYGHALTNPIATNRNPRLQSSLHRFDDDNISMISNSSLATSFSKSFLFAFLNNKQKDRLKNSSLLSKEYWMKDETSTECFICGSLFTTFRRKHHCRICGQIFCSNCTTLISGEKFNHSGKMRVCKTCISFANDYNDSSDDSSVTEETLVERSHSHDNDQESILPGTPNEDKISFSNPTPPPRMAIPATRNGESVEIPVSRLFNSRMASIHTAKFGRRKTFDRSTQYQPYFRPNSDDHTGNTSSILRNPPETSFADYVSSHNNSSSGFNFNNEAVHDNNYETAPANQFSDSEDENSMSIYAALHLEKSDVTNSSKQETKTRPSRSNTRSLDRAQASLYRMRNYRKSKSFSKSGTNLPSSFKFNDSNTSNNYNSPHGNPTFGFEFPNAEEEPRFNSELNEVCLQHFINLLNQCLEDEEVPDLEKWKVTLKSVLREVEKVEYNVSGGENMDIRQYIKLKRLSGGNRKDTKTIDGLVFSGTLALKTMPKHIKSPRIALIMFPLEYSKTGQHFMSLEPVLAQEKEYINKLVARIIALNPDVVFVGASVSGLALKLLDEAGMAVAYGMKPQVIERIAKLTQADIVITMDKLSSNLKLGMCEALDVKTFAYKDSTKTVIFLTGCNPRLGLTMLIRGGDSELLRKIKDTAEFMVYALCNLKLESAFYRDNFMYLSQNFYTGMVSQTFEADDRFGSEFLKSFTNRLLSVSPTVQFEPPYLLTRTRQLEERLIQIRESFENLSVNKVISKSLMDEIKLDTTKYSLSEEEYLKIVKKIAERKIKDLEDGINLRKRQWELYSASSPSMLDPLNHQRIAFLYSMVSKKSATPCIGPQPLLIDYYWDTDMTLGQYVEHLIQSANNSCTEGCGELIADHYRSYVHGRAKVDVIVERFQTIVPTLQNMILTWSYCKQCGHSSPFLPMSETTWKFSFGKYLELLFWPKRNSSTNLGNCPHDFAKDHIKYFSLNDLTVRMEYSNVDLLELITPRTKLVWKPHTNIKLKVEIHEQLIQKSQRFFNSISARLNRVKVDSMSNDKMEAGQKRIEQLKEKVGKEERQVNEMVEETYSTTDVANQLAMNSVLRFVQDLSVEWDSEFARFEEDFLPSEKDIARITTQQLKKFFMDNSAEKHQHVEESESSESAEETEEVMKSEGEAEGRIEEKEVTLRTENSNKINPSPRKPSSSSLKSNSSPIDSSRQGRVLEEVSKFEKLLENEEEDSGKRISSKGSVDMERTKHSKTTSDLKSKLPQIVFDTPKLMQKSNYLVNSGIKSSSSSFERKESTISDDTIPKTELSSSLPSFTKPRFGISTKDLELQLKEGRQAGLASNSSSVSVTPKVKSASKEDSKVMKLTNFFDQIHFETLSKEFEMQRQKERLKLIQNRYKAAPVTSSRPIVEVYKSVKDAVSEDVAEPVVKSNEENIEEIKKDEKKGLDSGIKDTDIPQTERVSLMKTLASFWADRSATLWKPLEYPLSSSEHIFVDSDVIVREDEPSTLVAFCLSSSDYVQKIHSIRDVTSNDLESIMLKKTAVHLKYQFQDGGTILSCKIFFAEQFDAFRQTCGIDTNFIQSLSRCVKWNSAGGKSGSAFLKTLDDRLVIKELSGAELDSFVKFAPSYFEYMTQALFHDLPTVLAKIFGFYQIHIKNPIDGRNFKMDVLIMENLFYDRKNLRIFDLKGSMRNRHVEQTGKENEVLLDENMVEYIYESPLFVREYDKKLLRASLWNDTLFLAKMNVMDYSLVIGIDDQNKTLTVGIIDCIRTFTWDKKLESWVKEKGLVGGGTKEPTVVTPRQYKNRFREAMERYILVVPDSWFQGMNGQQTV